MTDTNEQRVTVTVTDGVADVRLNRPDKRNALDHAMFDGIFAAADQVANDASVRVVVLSGVGKAFCAGLDTSLLSQMAGERTTESGAFRNLRVDAPRGVFGPVILGEAFGQGRLVRTGAAKFLECDRYRFDLGLAGVPHEPD